MNRIQHPNGVITYTFDNLAAFPVSAHISTRHGGVSPAPWNSLNFSVKRGDSRERVYANRERLADALQVHTSEIVSCDQVHGRNVAKVDRDDAGVMQRGFDGMVTNSESLPLSLVFADCVPVVLYDAKRHVLGVCHSGWRGTVQGIAAATLESMVEQYDVDPADVYAGIGPSIGPDSYEVGQEVVDAANGFFDNTEGIITYRNGAAFSHTCFDGMTTRPHFDLWEANRSLLVYRGVPPEQIELSGIDTATNTHDFFSHRGEKGKCGLFAMVAWLRPQE